MLIIDIVYYFKVSVLSIIKVLKKFGFIGFYDLKFSIFKNINNNEDIVDIFVIFDFEGFIEKIFESIFLNFILVL